MISFRVNASSLFPALENISAVYWLEPQRAARYAGKHTLFFLLSLKYCWSLNQLICSVCSLGTIWRHWRRWPKCSLRRGHVWRHRRTSKCDGIQHSCKIFVVYQPEHIQSIRCSTRWLYFWKMAMTVLNHTRSVWNVEFTCSSCMEASWYFRKFRVFDFALINTKKWFTTGCHGRRQNYVFWRPAYDVSGVSMGARKRMDCCNGMRKSG